MMVSDDVRTGNYLQDDQDIVESLVALDSQLHTVSLAIESGVGEKYVESVTTLITKNTSHDFHIVLLLHLRPQLVRKVRIWMCMLMVNYLPLTLPLAE